MAALTLAQSRKTGIGLLSALALLAGGPAGFAAEPDAAGPPRSRNARRAGPGRAGSEPSQRAGEAEAPEPKLLGDLGGLRPALDKYGIDLDLSYIGETFGVVHGGVKRGAIYEGQAGIALARSRQVARLVRRQNLRQRANIHGRGASQGCSAAI